MAEFKHEVMSDDEVRAMLSSPHGKGFKPRHPWDELLDGRWHAVKFSKSLRTGFYATAAKRGMVAECRRLTDGRLAIRALPKAEPQP